MSHHSEQLVGQLANVVLVESVRRPLFHPQFLSHFECAKKANRIFKVGSLCEPTLPHDALKILSI